MGAWGLMAACLGPSMRAAGDPRDVSAGSQPPAAVSAMPDANWRVVDRTLFRSSRNDYGRYYTLNQDYKPAYEPDAVLPKDALQINASPVNDCWIQLGPGCPWRVKWEIEVYAITEDVVLVPEADGMSFQGPGGTPLTAAPGIPLASGWHEIRVVRDSNAVTVSVDGRAESVTFVNTTYQPSLRMTVREMPRVWVRNATISIPPGEAWQDPASPHGATAADAPPWRVVYSQAFDTADCTNDFVLQSTSGTATWLPDEKCLRLRSGRDPAGLNLRYWLQRDLPGDIRVSFRARNAANEDHFFGVYINCIEQEPEAMYGYFCEWNRGWMRRIKKRSVQRAIVHPYEPQIHDPTWINFRVERAGSRISMYKDGKLSLDWTDPAPTEGPQYKDLCFYTWGMQIDIDDVIIEQNAQELAARGWRKTPMAGPDGGMSGTPVGMTASPYAADTVVLHEFVTLGADAAGPAPPVLEDLRAESGQLSFRWRHDPTCTYEVQTCTTLTGTPVWITAKAWQPPAVDAAYAAFSGPVSVQGHAFFRVIARRATTAP